ncbi:MAG: ATP-binding protein, partial [bacterium]
MKQNPKFLKGFESYCRNENLFASRDHIVVAVSGGVDSMVLLHCLHALSTQYQMKLISAHLNHTLRGNEADEDEDFVREHCLKLKVPFISAV